MNSISFDYFWLSHIDKKNFVIRLAFLPLGLNAQHTQPGSITALYTNEPKEFDGELSEAVSREFSC